MANHKSTSKHKKKKNHQSKNRNKSYQNKYKQAIDLPMIGRDDLLTIKGIDPTTEMALNSIGIKQFSDFNNHTPSSLAKALKERAGIDISTEVIDSEDWIEHAQLLAKKQSSQIRSNGEEQGLQEESMEDTHLQENPNKEDSVEKDAQQKTDVTVRPKNEDNIHEHCEEIPLSKFEIENTNTEGTNLHESAQLKIKPQSTDTKKQEKKSMIEASKKMAEAEQSESAKIHQPESKTSRQTARKLQPLQDSVPDVSLQIKNVHFERDEIDTEADTTGPQMLHAVISCGLAGSNVEELITEHLPLCVQIHAIDQHNFECELLAVKSVKLQPSTRNYVIRLDIKAAKIGYYKLQVVAFLLSAKPRIDFYKGPYLKVIS